MKPVVKHLESSKNTKGVTVSRPACYEKVREATKESAVEAQQKVSLKSNEAASIADYTSRELFAVFRTSSRHSKLLHGSSLKLFRFKAFVI